MPFRFLLALFVMACAISPVAIAEAIDVKTEGCFAPTRSKLDPAGTRTLLRETSLWDTFSSGGEAKGKLTYGPFVAEKSIELAIAGWPGANGTALFLQFAEGSQRLPLRPRSFPNDRWCRYRWSLPAEWAGRQVFLVAEDSSDDPAGWLGVSAPLPGSLQLGTALSETALLIAVWLLLLVPGFCLLLLLPARWTLAPLPVIIAGSSLVCYVGFFCYFTLPAFGVAFSYLALACCGLVLVTRRQCALGWLAQPGIHIPLLISLGAGVLHFIGGFLYGGTESPLGVPIERFLVNMPPDPVIPHWFARTLARAEPLRPFFADWLTSDRPPLQACLNLLVWPFVPLRMGYLAVGVAAQSWVWLGLWFFAERLRVPTRATALIMAGAVFSGFFFLNTFFCWPKLLPAAFLLCVAGLLWSGSRKEVPAFEASVVAAACMAFAFLGHGGSVFGAAAIVVVYLMQRRGIAWRFIVTTVAVGGLLMTPWTLYQRVADPPGDRLVKYHLAGREAIDQRSSFTVIKEAYSELEASKVARNKLENLRVQFFGNGNVIAALRTWAAGADEGESAQPRQRLLYALREAAFFHYAQALGPLLFGLAGLLALFRGKKRTTLLPAAVTCAALCFASIVVWCLLMFKGGSAVIHQGSYFTGACLFALAGVCLAALPELIASAILAVNLLWFIAVWLLAPQHSDAGELLPSGFGGFWLVWSGLAVFLLVFLHLLSAKSIAPPISPAPPEREPAATAAASSRQLA